MALELTAVFRKAPEGGYVAFVEELPGANTQGETLEEAREPARGRRTGAGGQSRAVGGRAGGGGGYSRAFDCIASGRADEASRSRPTLGSPWLSSSPGRWQPFDLCAHGDPQSLNGAATSRDQGFPRTKDLPRLGDPDALTPNEMLQATGAECIMMAAREILLQVECSEPASLPPAGELWRYTATRFTTR